MPTFLQPSPGAVKTAPQSFKALIREHAIVLALLAAYLWAAVGFAAPFPERVIVRIRLFDRVLFVMLQMYVIAFVVGFSLLEVRRTPAGTPALVHLWRTLRARYLNRERLPGFLLMFVYARVFTDVFISLKGAIPLINPFSWDVTFAQWDRALHFGREPWELLEPIATPVVTVALNLAYNLWIFVLFGVYIWQAWSRNRALRERFFVAFALAWMLLGTAAATALSSAGPCFYSRVTSSSSGPPPENTARLPHDPYAPLMDYLYAVDRERRVWALAVQESLWEQYARAEDETLRLRSAAAEPVSLTDAQPLAVARAAEGEARPNRDTPASAEARQMLNGISAMPSMHVAMSMLFALVGWHTHRVVGAAFTAFAFAIALGSVHLGWHYAVDGYFSMIAMPILWWAAGRLVNWRRSLGG